jgi:hypothetical protein
LRRSPNCISGVPVTGLRITPPALSELKMAAATGTAANATGASAVGQNHRRDRGHATNSAKTRDADRRGSAAALRLLSRDQDQPHRGGQDEDRARDRHQRPGTGLATYHVSASPVSPGTGPKGFCGLTAVRLAIP